MDKTRKKLGGTSMNVLNNQEKDVNSKVGRKGDRAGFHTIDKGWNKHRIYPAHPGTESFIYPSVKYFVPFEDENGKIVKKPVFNSKVHGGTEKDIVDEYIKFLTESLSHLEGPALEKALAPISFNGDYSLIPKTEWVMYSDKYDQKGKKLAFARLSITPGSKNKMEKLIPTENADEEIVLEPFTDEEDGIAIIIHYNPNAVDKKGKKDLKNFYNLELEQKKIDKFKIELVPTPLSQKEVEDFLKVETLESMYKNSYRLKDFNMALSGLEIIDKECKYNILNDPNFLSIIEEIRNYYPEDEEGVVEEEVSEEISEEDDLTDLNREDLKKLIVKEFGKGVIVVKTNNSDDDIRNMIRDKRKELATVQPEVEQEEEMVEEEPNDVIESTESTDSIEALRAARAAKKK